MALVAATTYSIKLSGKYGTSTTSKTLSNVSYGDFANDPNEVNTLAKRYFNVVDSGTAVSFNVVKTDKYDVAD